jgi:hypothetical protein
MATKKQEKKAFLGNSNKKKFEYPLENLKKHFIALGSSGSGKTVLTKILVEECGKLEIPSIVVDIQGDLSALALKGDKKKLLENGFTEKQIKDFHDKTEIKIFTPASSKGIPLCINPLDIETSKLSEEEKIPLLHDTAHALTKLLGYNITNQKGKKTQAILYTLLKNLEEKNEKMKNFEELIEYLNELPSDINQEIQQYGADEKDLEELIRNIKFLNLGEKKLLFQFGVPLDINFLLGKNKKNKKTSISIINLNTLPSQEEKEFFLTTLTSKIYQWMLKNPSNNLQFSYIIDEIAPFIPSGNKKTLPKSILKKVFKQARKYGVGCIIATQNPGDIDYQAFSQFGSWAIGRLSVKQDIKKIEQALSSISGINKFQKELPKMKAGEFNIFAPDVSQKIIKLKTRWLYTKHQTLTGEQIREITQEYQKEFKKHYVKINPEKEEPKENELEQKTPNKIKKTEQKTNFFEEETEDTIGELQVKGINSKQVIKIAEKEQKKLFKLFGNNTEKISDVKKIWEPYFLTQIRQKKDSFFGLKKEIKRHHVLFNAKTGEIMILNKNKSKKLKSSKKLPFLEETPLITLKEIFKSKKPLTSIELIPKTQLTKRKINEILNSLEDKSFITHKTISGYKQWYSIEPFKTENIEKISSIIPPGKKEIIKDKKEKPQITEKEIKRFVSSWFKDADVTGCKIIYIPFYMIIYTNKKGLRKLKINGITSESQEI